MKKRKFSIGDTSLERSPGRPAEVFVGNLVDERYGWPITVGYGRYAPGQSLTGTMAVDDAMIVLEERLSVSTDSGSVTAGLAIGGRPTRRLRLSITRAYRRIRLPLPAF